MNCLLQQEPKRRKENRYNQNVFVRLNNMSGEELIGTTTQEK